MKTKILIILVLGLFVLKPASAQEQFEKRFDISFHNDSLYQAVKKLTKTQSHMVFHYYRDKLSKSLPVTADLKDVTFDQAMAKILASQNIYKDYWVYDYGGAAKLTMLELKETSGDPRYVDRHKNKGRYYNVGENLPDLAYSIANYPEKTIKLSGLKKKLIILDIWNINCISCIQGMPKMEKLQEQFKDQIQIILVTRDTKEMVDTLKKRSVIVRNTKLPIITGENVLGSLFNYIGLPTEVWLDENGKIVYFTARPINSAKYINDFIAGKRLDIPLVKDTLVSNSQLLAVALAPLHKGRFGITSYLAPHREDKYHYTGGGGGFMDTSTVKIASGVGSDVYTIYRTAYWGHALNDKIGDYVYLRMPIIEKFKDKSRFTPDPVTFENIYDHELITKSKNITTQRFYHLMQTELDAYFNLKSYKVKQQMPCYVLKRINNSNKSIGPINKNMHPEIVDGIMTADNVPFSALLHEINHHFEDENFVFLNGTGFPLNSNISLKMNMDFAKNMITANRLLAPYGLKIVKEQRMVDCIILTDAKN